MCVQVVAGPGGAGLYAPAFVRLQKGSNVLQTMLQGWVAQQAGPGFEQMLLPIGMFAIIYFVMIRPQQKQMKDQQDLIAALKKGDDVVTAAGVIGRIHQVGEKEIQLEVAPNVRIRILKSSIQGRAVATGETSAADAKKEGK